MALNKNEKLLIESIKNMLKQDAKLGLSIHNSEDDGNFSERGYEYLHNQIDEMYAIKAAELVHAESVTSSFNMVHSYKYLDDPSFPTAVEKEMVAKAVPAEERKRALGFIPKIIEELREEQRSWTEKDSGFNPNLDEILDTTRDLGQDMDFKIHDAGGYNKLNFTKPKHGDASPGHLT